MLTEIMLYVPNKARELSKVLEALKVVNIQAYSIEDAGKLNRVRLIVNDSKAALYQLDLNGYNKEYNSLVSLPVLGIELPHRAGELSRVAQFLGENNINIEHSFLTLELDKKKAIVIIDTDDNSKAATVLKDIDLRTCDHIEEPLESLASPLPDGLDIYAGSDNKKLENMIKRLENDFVEFKSTMRYDLDTSSENKVNKELGKAICKTLAAFMNSNGGTLLIGVNPDSSIRGLEEDFSTLGSLKNDDGFLQVFRNMIETWGLIGNLPLITHRFTDVGEKRIFVVEVRRNREEPVYLGKDEDFYIRALSSSIKLNTRDALTYIKLHWQSSKKRSVK
ncbi:MAG: putative DNA binding domain-containing protein [Chloroflexi bacterium]|nr:putative DNA binding domain-containing protein [Chloroflexota bacterium]